MRAKLVRGADGAVALSPLQAADAIRRPAVRARPGARASRRVIRLNTRSGRQTRNAQDSLVPERLCVPNISTVGARRRAITARVATIFAAILGFSLATAGARPLLYATLALPIALASMNFFQVREKT